MELEAGAPGCAGFKDAPMLKKVSADPFRIQISSIKLDDVISKTVGRILLT